MDTQYCKACRCHRPKELFIGVKGKPTVKCYRCNVMCIAYINRKLKERGPIIKKKRAPMTQEEKDRRRETMIYNKWIKSFTNV